jgi:hypothetical protein
MLPVVTAHCKTKTIDISHQSSTRISPKKKWNCLSVYNKESNLSDIKKFGVDLVCDGVRCASSLDGGSVRSVLSVGPADW